MRARPFLVGGFLFPAAVARAGGRRVRRSSFALAGGWVFAAALFLAPPGALAQKSGESAHG